MTRKLVRYLKDALESRGIHLQRVWPPPLRLHDAIRNTIPGPAAEGCHAILWDRDPRTLRAFSSVLPPGHVHVAPASAPAFPHPPATSHSRVLSAAAIPDWPHFPQDIPNIDRIDVLVGTCALSAFIHAGVDLPATLERAESAGFRLHDVSIDAEFTAANAACARTAFVWVRDVVHRPTDARGAERISRARAFLSRPLLDLDSAISITWPGEAAHAAGPFNPGAVHDGDRTLVVCRAETDLWPAQVRDERRHFSSWRCILIMLDNGGATVSASELECDLPSELAHARIEDLRLFRAGGRILCNHSVVDPPGGGPPANRSLQIKAHRYRTALSELDASAGRLKFLGFPRLDFPLQQVEKNWAMFEHQGGVALIYSMAPLRAFISEAASPLDFRNVAFADTPIPWLDARIPVRNSINPVGYDDAHLLHVVHQVYPTKQYVFWGVLLDRQTLRPVSATVMPLARSAGIRAPSILYLCSATADGGSLTFYAGLNDNSACLMRIPREELAHSFRSLECAPRHK